jgi:HKD family nuclease
LHGRHPSGPPFELAAPAVTAHRHAERALRYGRDAGAGAQVLGDGRAFGAALRRDLGEARGLSVAVAFAKQSGLAELDLEAWCRADRKLQLLAGTDFFLTELALLRRLDQRPRADCRIFHQLGQRRTFHPKLYVLDKGASRVVYVGSSNFTRGGLGDNIEANVRLEGPAAAPELADAEALFGRMFDGEYATKILEDAEYERRYDEMQARQRAALDHPSLVEPRGALAEGLKEHLRSMPNTGDDADFERSPEPREARGGAAPTQTLMDVLLSMPDVGDDADFERPVSYGRPDVDLT